MFNWKEWIFVWRLWNQRHPINNASKIKELSPLKDNDKRPDYTLEYVFHRIDIDFVNANPNVELVTEKISADYDNYYNVPINLRALSYTNTNKLLMRIFTQILTWYSPFQRLFKTVEYNFVVHPKGKISDIQLKFSGAKRN
jgi:hypothetical protein